MVAVSGIGTGMLTPGNDNEDTKTFLEADDDGKVNDPGGYWWPLTYSSWTPTIVSFSFLVSLIIAQFTIFSSFRVLNFRSHFEALNDVFLASNG